MSPARLGAVFRVTTKLEYDRPAVRWLLYRHSYGTIGKQRFQNRGRFYVFSTHLENRLRRLCCFGSVVENLDYVFGIQFSHNVHFSAAYRENK